MKILELIAGGAILSVSMAGGAFAQYGDAGSDTMTTKPAAAMEPMAAHGKYSEDTKAGFDAAKDKKRVIFFAEKGCPVCMGTIKAMQEQPASIPAGVEVFKADFETSTDLKSKYGVTKMDTFVQVSMGDEKLAQWSGGAESLAKNVK